MVKIKVCGITKEEEIQFLNELSPDYIGFLFSESKRKVSVEQAYELRAKLNKDIKTVGVFVNENLDFVNSTVDYVKLDFVQLHGEEDQNYINKVEKAVVWKALGVKDEAIAEIIEKYKVDGVVLDSAVKGMRGGSGVSFNWKLASELSKKHKIILAGGLNNTNIAEAIRIVNPSAVDVSSGVEGENGKDFDKCKKFIHEVRKICKEDLDNSADNMFQRR